MWSSSQLIPNICGFWLFTFWPDASSKRFMQEKRFLMSSSLCEENKIVSSANWRWLICKLLRPIVKPWMWELFYALVKIRLRQSATRMKKKGESGSPCRRPLEARIFPRSLPLIMMEKFGEETQPRIHLLHLSPNPLAFKIKSRKSQSNISNAFSTSNLRTTPFWFFWNLSSVISFAMSEASRICLPATNAVCCSKTV